MQHRGQRRRKDWGQAQPPHRALQLALARRQRMDWLRQQERRRHTDFPPRRDWLQAPQRRTGWLLRRDLRQHKGCRRRKDCSSRTDLARQRQPELAPEPVSSS